MRVTAGPDGVDVGVVVWVGSVAVGVGMTMGCWVEDVDVGLVGGSSGMMSIGAVVVSVSVALESLSDRRQGGVNSACPDHNVLGR